MTQVAVRIADREAEALQEAGLVGFGAGGGGAVGRRGSERALRVLPGVTRARLLRTAHSCAAATGRMLLTWDVTNAAVGQSSLQRSCSARATAAKACDR